MPKKAKRSLCEGDGPAKSGIRRQRFKQPLPVPKVSEEKRERLLCDALNHPAFDRMGLNDIKAFIDRKVREFLATQPFWYGHMDGPSGADTRHQTAHRQYKDRNESAGRKARQRKAQRNEGGEHVTTATIADDQSAPATKGEQRTRNA